MMHRNLKIISYTNLDVSCSCTWLESEAPGRTASCELQLDDRVRQSANSCIQQQSERSLKLPELIFLV